MNPLVFFLSLGYLVIWGVIFIFFPAIGGSVRRVSMNKVDLRRRAGFKRLKWVGEVIEIGM